MLNVWRKLLLIALCLQIPFAALAAATNLHQHDNHHHEVSVHDEHAAPAQDQDTAATECVAVHHCSGTHFQALGSAAPQISVIEPDHFFGLSSQAPPISTIISPIERPKWARI